MKQAETEASRGQADDAYVSWREACLQVRDAYGSWASETGLGATSAFGRYMAALEPRGVCRRVYTPGSCGAPAGWRSAGTILPNRFGGAVWGVGSG